MPEKIQPEILEKFSNLQNGESIILIVKFSVLNKELDFAWHCICG